MEAGEVRPVGKVENLDNPLTIDRSSPGRPRPVRGRRAPVDRGDSRPGALMPLHFGAPRRGEAGAPAVASHVAQGPGAQRRPGGSAWGLTDG